MDAWLPVCRKPGEAHGQVHIAWANFETMAREHRVAKVGDRTHRLGLHAHIRIAFG